MTPVQINLATSTSCDVRQGARAVTKRFSYPTSAAALRAPRWCKDFLRYPVHDASLCDSNYLLNQADASGLFYDWFVGGMLTSYIHMICQQHTVACTGSSGSRPYTLRSRDGEYRVRKTWPGVLRRQLTLDRIVHPSVDVIRLSANELKTLFAAEDRVLETVSDSGVVKLHSSHGIVGSIPIKLEIRGIPDEAQPKTRFYANGFFARLAPFGESERAFALRTENCMRELGNLTALGCLPNVSAKAKILQSLAIFYHTAVHWMPFAHVNNSLLMGQVNVILRHCGSNSVPHRNHDAIALVSSTEAFTRYFVDYIRHSSETCFGL